MIGTNLNLTLPLLSDTMSAMVTKTSAALSAIEVSIADQATQAAINVTAPLTLNGNLLINTGGIKLVDGNTPSGAGSLYYHNNELYAVDSTGIVQLTLNGQINVAGIGGIGGDYGGADPALVSYNLASGQYRFYINGGSLTFADLAARSLLLKNSAFTATVSAASGQTVNYTLTLPVAPPAAQALVQIGTTGVLTATNVLANNQNLQLQGTGYLKSGNKTITIPAIAPLASASSGIAKVTNHPGIAVSASTSFVYDLPMPDDAGRIQSISVVNSLSGTGNWTIEFGITIPGTGFIGAYAYSPAQNIAHDTNPATISGAGAGLPYPTSAGLNATPGETIAVRITTPATISGTVQAFTVTYDVP